MNKEIGITELLKTKGWLLPSTNLPHEGQQVTFIARTQHQSHLDGVTLGGHFINGSFTVPGMGLDAYCWKPQVENLEPAEMEMLKALYSEKAALGLGECRSLPARDCPAYIVDIASTAHQLINAIGQLQETASHAGTMQLERKLQRTCYDLQGTLIKLGKKLTPGYCKAHIALQEPRYKTNFLILA